MITEGRMIVREGARYWWVFLLTGIAWLLIALLVLRMDITSIAAVGVLLGVVFLFASVNEVGLGSLMSGGWKILHYVMALIFFIWGLWSLVRPVDTFFALFKGITQIVNAFGIRHAGKVADDALTA